MGMGKLGRRQSGFWSDVDLWRQPMSLGAVEEVVPAAEEKERGCGAHSRPSARTRLNSKKQG
jgi:hypothetical protein